MTDDQLQFSISQYLDGTLPEDQRAALEARLAEDPEAQALLAEDETLTAALRSISALPDVRWDRLALSISQAIDDDLEARMAQASWWMRMRVPTGLVALAACLLIAFGIAFHGFGTHHAQRETVAIGPSQVPPVLMVEGPAEDRPVGPVVSQISIEAGGTYAKDASLSPYADEIDTRPARVVIASGINPSQPAATFPY